MENVIQIGKETKQNKTNQFGASHLIFVRFMSSEASPYRPPGNSLKCLGPDILILILPDGCGMDCFSLKGEPYITPPSYV